MAEATVAVQTFIIRQEITEIHEWAKLDELLDKDQERRTEQGWREKVRELFAVVPDEGETEAE